MMRRAIKVVFFGLGLVALIAAVNLTYKLDEWLGCDLGDHAEICIARGAAALRNWFSASDYERFLVGGADHEAFVGKTKDFCIASNEDKKQVLNKTEEQLAVFCGCWANNLGALATATDLRYIARHQQPPSALAQRLDELAPDCARLADLVRPARPN